MLSWLWEGGKARVCCERRGTLQSEPRLRIGAEPAERFTEVQQTCPRLLRRHPAGKHQSGGSEAEWRCRARLVLSLEPRSLLWRGFFQALRHSCLNQFFRRVWPAVRLSDRQTDSAVLPGEHPYLRRMEHRGGGYAILRTLFDAEKEAGGRLAVNLYATTSHQNFTGCS